MTRTRGEFWAKKILLACELKNDNTIETVANAISAECVRFDGDGESNFCAHFSDGSWVKGVKLNQHSWKWDG